MSRFITFVIAFIMLAFMGGCHHHHHSDTTYLRTAVVWSGDLDCDAGHERHSNRGHGHAYGRAFEETEDSALFSLVDCQTRRDGFAQSAHTDLTVTNLTKHREVFHFTVSGTGWSYSDEAVLNGHTSATFNNVTKLFWSLSNVKVTVECCPVEHG